MAAIDGFLRPLFFFRDVFEVQLKELTQPAEQKDVARTQRISRDCFELMDYHGEFDRADPEWRRKSDLERAVLDALAREGKTPAVSTVRELIAETPQKVAHLIRLARPIIRARQFSAFIGLIG